MKVFDKAQSHVRQIKSGVGRFVSTKRILSYPIEVQKHFNVNEGGLRVGSITYFMFLSMLPFLIVSLTIFDLVFVNNPALQKMLTNSTLATIPVIGPTLEANLSFVKDRGTTLVVTLLIMMWSSKAGTMALEAALRSISTHRDHPRNFFSKTFRAYGAMAIIAIGLFIPTFINTIYARNASSQLWIFLLSCVWNTLLLFLIFLVLVDFRFAKGKGIFLGGVGISLIQFFSILIMARSLGNSQPLYGTLAVVLVLFAWIALQVRVMLYCAVVNVTKW